MIGCAVSVVNGDDSAHSSALWAHLDIRRIALLCV